MTQTMSHLPPTVDFIQTVNVSHLRHFAWPFMRVLSQRFVARAELGYLVESLLREGRWDVIHVIPHVEDGQASDDLFDLYGRAAGRRSP
jgi:hypothetical protein